MFTGCGMKDSYEQTSDSPSSEVGSSSGWSSNDSNEEMEEADTDYGVQPEAIREDFDGATDESKESQDSMEVLTQTTETDEKGEKESLQEKVDARKYILTYRYYLETLEFEKAEANLEHMVENSFGFFESTEVSGRSINDENRRRRGNYTIRIPKEKVNEFVDGLQGIGNVLDSNSFVEDVTSRYYDMDARIRTLKIQEERLLAILEKADELEYIIELERELSDVRYEIESYTSSFRRLEDQISYSTVYVELQEVYEKTVIKQQPLTFTEKLTRGFLDSVEDVKDLLENLILFLLTNIPLFVLLLVSAFALYRIIRYGIKRRKKEGKSKKEKAKENHQDE